MSSTTQTVSAAGTGATTADSEPAPEGQVLYADVHRLGTPPWHQLKYAVRAPAKNPRLDRALDLLADGVGLGGVLLACLFPVTVLNAMSGMVAQLVSGGHARHVAQLVMPASAAATFSVIGHLLILPVMFFGVRRFMQTFGRSQRVATDPRHYACIRPRSRVSDTDRAWAADLLSRAETAGALQPLLAERIGQAASEAIYCQQLEDALIRVDRAPSAVAVAQAQAALDDVDGLDQDEYDRWAAAISQADGADLPGVIDRIRQIPTAAQRSDADAALAEAFAQGKISRSEMDERLETVLAATHIDELYQVSADLA